MRRTPRTALEHWSSPTAVSLTDGAPGAERYERRLLDDSVAAAGGTGAVRVVHVLGVGTGRELAAVREAAPRAAVRAWDLSPAMVERCRARVAGEGWDDVDVAVRDVTDLGPGDGPAELVVALNGFYGCVVPGASRRAVLRGAAAALAPGGVLVMVVQQRHGRPDWAVWFGLRDLLVVPFRPGEEHGDRHSGRGDGAALHHHVSVRELRADLDAAGLTVQRLCSLRRFVRPMGLRPPLRSPNPLLVVARAA